MAGDELGPFVKGAKGEALLGAAAPLAVGGAVVVGAVGLGPVAAAEEDLTFEDDAVLPTVIDVGVSDFVEDGLATPDDDVEDDAMELK